MYIKISRFSVNLRKIGIMDTTMIYPIGFKEFLPFLCQREAWWLEEKLNFEYPKIVFSNKSIILQLPVESRL